MKLNIKDNKTKLILFFMITGWLRILILVIPGIWIYMNTQDWRTNDNIPTLKIEQGD